MRKLRNEELNRLDIEQFKVAEKAPIILVLDNVRSMMNVGSAFRTADAFRIDEILLTGITAKPPHREINKAALGATESVSWKYFDLNKDAIKYLRERKSEIHVIEQADESESLANDRIVNKERPVSLIFGNEVDGVSDEFIEVADRVIEIEQYGTKHSLNISVSIGVVVWEYFKGISESIKI